MAKQRAKNPEVIVIGAGPAGATAALILAQAGRQVTLLDSASFPRPKPCAGWLSPRGVDFCAELGIDVARKSDIIEDVRFMSSDLTQTARPAKIERLGVLIDRTAFDEQLVAAARKAGVTFHDRFTVATLRPGEDAVEVESVEGKVLCGRVAVLAAGVSQRLAGQIGVHIAPDGAAVNVAHVSAQVDAPGGGLRNRLTVVLEPGGDGCCLAIEHRKRISLTLYGRKERAALLDRLVELASALHAKGFVSADLSRDAAKAPCGTAYRCNALNADTHVGKLCLVVGDAGGFYATVSHEGIFPAMWSGQIAARVIHKALSAKHVQDALIAFDREWRLTMANFLRPPNTELPLLIPLIFSNQPMAERMGAAFFMGENI